MMKRGDASSPLAQLKEDTVKAYNGEFVDGSQQEGKGDPEAKVLEHSEEDDEYNGKVVEDAEVVTPEEEA